MTDIIRMLNDSRQISSIYTYGEDWTEWAAGRLGVTKIVAYEEDGNTWFAVYEGDHIVARVNAAAVEIVYYS